MIFVIVSLIFRERESNWATPQVSLEQGIPELLKWVSEQTPEDRVSKATAELETRQLVH